MYCVKKRTSGYAYIHVVESYRKDSKVKQHMLWSLGRFDKETFLRVKQKLKNWKRLERSRVVIGEVEDKSGRMQGERIF